MLTRNGLRLWVAGLTSLICLEAYALPARRPIETKLRELTALDVFDDTIRYDDGTVQWWYGGLQNYYLTTRFTPSATFSLQRMIVALLDSNLTEPIDLWLKSDVAGAPGPVLWSGSLLYNQSSTWLGVTLSGGNRYTFAAGQSFWLELRSPGPPYECYDAAPIEPPRSYTNYPSPSPGDNFIRAVGEYTATVVDVGVDSLWHGENFFRADSVTYQVGCRVRNYGNLSATFAVSCSLYAAFGFPLSSLGSQNVTVPAGQAATVVFAPFYCGDLGLYFFRARTYLSGDGNADNNSAEIETQIYNMPPETELVYDDGAEDGAALTTFPGDGWGMKFDPHLTGSYRVTNLMVYVDTIGNYQPSRIQLLANNPATNAPGAVLWQTVTVPGMGWNTYAADRTCSGPVYVSYIFEYGQYSAPLCYDSDPISGECWSKMSGVWEKGNCLNDWMMRIEIDTSGSSGGSRLWVDVTPNGPTVFPASGGTLAYIISGGNRGSLGQTADVWAMVRKPNGTIYGPVLGPLQDYHFPAGYSTQENRTLGVPAGAPTGGYWLLAYLGNYNPPQNTVYVSDSLAFQKTNHQGHSDDFWSEAGDEAHNTELQNVPLPTEFALQPVYPNPFNASTAIRFELPAAGYVQLEILNASGRTVRTILRGWRSSGAHEVTFEATELPSGIYFCLMRAGDFVAAQKMVLLK